MFPSMSSSRWNWKPTMHWEICMRKPTHWHSTKSLMRMPKPTQSRWPQVASSPTMPIEATPAKIYTKKPLMVISTSLVERLPWPGIAKSMTTILQLDKVTAMKPLGTSPRKSGKLPPKSDSEEHKFTVISMRSTWSQGTPRQETTWDSTLLKWAIAKQEQPRQLSKKFGVHDHLIPK